MGKKHPSRSGFTDVFVLQCRKKKKNTHEQCINLVTKIIIFFQLNDQLHSRES